MFCLIDAKDILQVTDKTEEFEFIRKDIDLIKKETVMI